MNIFAKSIVCAATLGGFCLIQQSPAATPKVVVKNGTSNPVPVTVQDTVPVDVQNPVNTSATAADNPAFQPYEQGNSITIASNSNGGNVDFDVPAGKRLVIESVTVISFFPIGQHLVEASFRTTLGSVLLFHTLVVHPQPDDAVLNNAVSSASQLTRGYSDAGTGSVRVFIRRDSASGSGASANVSVTGYLVDVP